MTTTPRTIWYLAHPVAPDDRFTYEQNLAHVVHLLRVCYEEGFRVYAPWHTICLGLPDSDPEFRRIGLEVDCELVRLTGHLILCGHRLSSGMQQELNALLAVPGNVYLDGVGLNDDEFRTMLRENMAQVR